MVALGGVVWGSPQTQGAVANGASSATLDGGGSTLTGVIRPGDTFTVAGDPQEYEIVTAGVIGATTPNEVAITFTPTVQVAGGWADNAAVTFASNQMAEVTAWNATVERPYLDTTVQRDDARTGTLDTPQWSGNITAYFDYDDAEQKSVIDDLVANTAAVAFALTLVTDDGKQLWGDAHATQANITHERGALVGLAMPVNGDGQLAVDWN